MLAATLGLLLAAGSLTVAAAPATAAPGSLQISVSAGSPDSQQSGRVFHYAVSYSCSSVDGSGCSPQIVIPMGAAAGFSWAAEPALSSAKVGTDFVIELSDLDAGSSAQLDLRITPPNRTTPDGTTWSVTPSISDSGTTVVSAETVTSTATASSSPEVSKSASQQAVYPLQTFTYSLRWRCFNYSGVGELGINSIVVTDVIPPEVDYVSSTMGGSYDSATRTVSFVVDPTTAGDTSCTEVFSGAADNPFPMITVQAGATIPPTGGTVVTNTASFAFDAVGTNYDQTRTSQNLVTIYAHGDEPNGTTQKSAVGPVMGIDVTRSEVNTTYAGRWANSDIDLGADLFDSFSISGAVQSYLLESMYYIQGFAPSTSYGLSVVDRMPCASELSGATYSSPSSGVCSNPVWNPTIVTVGNSSAVPAAGYVPTATLTDSSVVDLEVYRGHAGWWKVPADAVGRVSSLNFPEVPGADTTYSLFEIGGYADSTLAPETKLINTANQTFTAGGVPLSTLTASDTLHLTDGVVLDITTGSGAMENVVAGQPTRVLHRPFFNLSKPSSAPLDADIVVTDLLSVDSYLESGYPTSQLIYLPTGQSFRAPLEVIDNYNGTGRQLLRITIPASTANSMLGTKRHLDQMYADFIIVTPYPGSYTATTQVFYNSIDQTLAGCIRSAAGRADPFDLDGDPAFGPACEWTSTYDIPYPFGVSAFSLRKVVQGDKDAGYRAAPTLGTVTRGGGDADFKVLFRNVGGGPLQDPVLYDVFPNPGDTGVSASSSGTARGSNFTPTLSAAISAPTGVTVYYSSSTNPCRPEVYANASNAGCVDDWTTTAPADLDSVKALKFTSAATFAQGEGFEVVIPMSTPAIGQSDVAYNALAGVATNATSLEVLQVTEAPKSGISSGSGRLSIDKTTTTPTVVAGGQARYLVTVTNDSARTLNDVTAVDTLPAGLELQYADGSPTQAGRVLTWEIPTLGIGETRSYAIGAGVPADAAEGTTYTNEFTAASPETTLPNRVSHQCANNSASSCAEVTVPLSPPPPAASLETVTKTVDVASAAPGDTVTYTITVHNSGAADDPRVYLYDFAPDELTFQSATVDGVAVTPRHSSWGEDNMNNVVIFAAVDIAAGATMTAVLLFTVNAAASGTLINAATAFSNGEVRYENSCSPGFLVYYPDEGGCASLTATATAAASIAGAVFVDGTSEPLPGVQIDLVDELGTAVATTTTAADGTYLFDAVAAGNYTVVETQPMGYGPGAVNPGNSIAVTMVTGEVLLEQDFSEVTLAVDPVGPAVAALAVTGLRGAWMLATGMAVLGLASGILLLVVAGRMRRRRGKQLELTF